MNDEEKHKEVESEYGSIKPWNVYWIKGPATDWQLLYGISTGGKKGDPWVDLTVPIEDVTPDFCWDQDAKCWKTDCLTSEKEKIYEIFKQLKHKDSRFYQEVEEDNRKKSIKTPPKFKKTSWWKKLFLEHE